MPTESDEWDAQMLAGMAMLASSDWDGASKVFERVRKEAPRHLTRSIATNNLAWTYLMVGTPDAAQEALRLAEEALDASSVENAGPKHLENMKGTLAFALIRTGEVGSGLALIEEVLAGDAHEPRQLALRLCIRAIGLARTGDAATARSLVLRARRVDPRCQLLTEAIGIIGLPLVVVPPVLQGLKPLLDRFGLADDVQRERVVREATSEDLKELLRSVTADVQVQINRYLDDTFDAEEAVPYGGLAQAATEASLELKQRGVPLI